MGVELVKNHYRLSLKHCLIKKTQSYCAIGKCEHKVQVISHSSQCVKEKKVNQKDKRTEKNFSADKVAHLSDNK